jgi:hypothetical protein
VLRRRWIPSGAIALAAHVGALLVALRPVSMAPLEAPPPEDAASSTIDLEDLPSPLSSTASREQARAGDEATQAVAREAAGAKPSARHASAASVPGEDRSESVNALPEVLSQSPGSAANDGWSFNPAKAGDWTGPVAIGRAVREGGAESKGAEGAVEAEGVSKSGGLVEGLDARDAALGLGRGGGAVVSALEVAARNDPTLAEGRATFDVGIDNNGRITVALVSASESAAAWAHVGEAMRGSLDPARVRIPPGASGWHVVAAVEAKVQYPNGADPKKMGTHVVGKSLEQPLALEHSGKVCTVRLQLGLVPLSGGCDPTNIGMHAARVVRGQVVSEGRL